MNKKPYSCGLFALGGTACFLLAIGFGSVQYMRHRDLNQRFPVDTSPIKVALSIPDSSRGTPSVACSPLFLTANATGEKPLLALELWANGMQVGSQASRSGGTKSLMAPFAWVPNEPGLYSLIVRATDTDKHTADSASVEVLVGPTTKSLTNKTCEDSATLTYFANGGGGLGTPPSKLDPPVLLPKPPAPLSPNTPISPADPWQGSVGDWLSSLSNTSSPNALQLSATSDGCSATLNIHDLKSHGDGFFVYRQQPNIKTWQRIATLSSKSGEGYWLKYSDSGTPGLLSYKISAFNNQGEASSNIVTVNVDPAKCPSKADKFPTLSLDLVSLKTDLGADRTYCYKSLGGNHWSRVPTNGFFHSGPSGFEIKGQTESVLLSGLEYKSVALDLECWGWVGNSLKLLGKVHQDAVNTLKPGAVQLSDKGLTVGLNLGLGGPVKTLWGSCNDCGPNPPTRDWRLPIPEACSPCTNDFQLTWVLNKANPNNCVDVNNCINPIGKFEDGFYGFNIYDLNSSDLIPIQSADLIFESTYDALSGPYKSIAPGPCNAAFGVSTYEVRLFHIPRESAVWFESFGSTAYVPKPCPPPKTVKLDVTFTNLHLDNVDDGINDVLIEPYGGFSAQSVSTNVGGLQGSGFILDKRKADSNYLGNGDYNFADFQLCKSDANLNLLDCPGDFQRGNNAIRVSVNDGDVVWLSIALMDYDAGSADDPACVASGVVGSGALGSIKDFASMKGAQFFLQQGNNGNASCVVTVTITAVSTP